jgi:peptidoglycan/LPS O-acetylase OafA/YrhL
MPSGFSPERTSLRGISASVIIWAHGFEFASLGAITSLSYLSYYYLQPIGWVGICLFLCLSIYLLMGRLDSGVHWKDYFKSRIKRLWPFYFAYCALSFVLFDRSLTALAVNVTFLGTFFPQYLFASQFGGWLPTGLAWTLQIEEWAYLAFPLISLLSDRWREQLGWMLVAVSFVYDARPFWGGPMPTYQEPFLWLAAYGVGLLVYQRMKRGQSMRAPEYMKWLSVALVAMTVVSPVLRWPWAILLDGPAVAWLVADPPQILRRWWLVAVGECSYATYLFQCFWVAWFGLAGVLMTYVSAWFLENVLRGKQIREHLAVARASSTDG